MTTVLKLGLYRIPPSSCPCMLLLRNERPPSSAAPPCSTSSATPAQGARPPKNLLHNPRAPNAHPGESTPLQTKPPPGLKSAMNRMAQAYVRSMGKWEPSETSLPHLPRPRHSHHNSRPPPARAGEGDSALLPPAGTSSSCSNQQLPSPARPPGKSGAAGPERPEREDARAEESRTQNARSSSEESRTQNARSSSEDSRIPDGRLGRTRGAEAGGVRRHCSSPTEASRSMDERFLRRRRREKSIFRPGTAPHLVMDQATRSYVASRKPRHHHSHSVQVRNAALSTFQRPRWIACKFSFQVFTRQPDAAQRNPPKRNKRMFIPFWVHLL